QLVMKLLVRLDDAAIERSGLGVTSALAQLDELRILYERDRFTGKLASRDPLYVALQTAEIPEHRPVARRQRTDPCESATELCGFFSDQTVVPGFVAGRPRESGFQAGAIRRRHPQRRHFAGLQLVAQSAAKQVANREVAASLCSERL